MIARFFLSGMWLQDSGSISSRNSTLLMIFVGLVALALIVQAIVLMIMAVVAAKASKRVLAIAEEVRAKAMPAIESTQDFVTNCAPKLLTLTENMMETSNIVRNKAVEFDSTLSDVNSKARAQAQKADDIANSVLDGASEIVNAVQHGIRVPVREFNGLVNGLKAGIDVLVGKPKGYNRNGRRYPEANDIDL